MLFLMGLRWPREIAGFDAAWLIVFWDGPICFCALPALGIAGMIADGAVCTDWQHLQFGALGRSTGQNA
jgi:hypothetical protein